MTKILTEESIKHSYDRKRNSCASRNISFDLSYDYYRMLIKNRPTMVCFFTSKPFDMRNTSSGNYPSLDRLDEFEGYTYSNTVLVTTDVNRVKNEVCEYGGKLRKGMPEKDIKLSRTIQKLLKCPEEMDKRKQVYYDLLDKVEERKQEVEQKITKAEQKVIKQTEEDKQAKIAQKFKEQQHFAKYYHQKAEEFSKLGVVMQISIKEMRDILRITKDAITKEPFNDIWDKHLWVVDKTKPITRSNVKVCKLHTQESLDHLAKGGSMVLKTAMKNLNKIL